MRFVRLRDFKKLKQPLLAKEIKEVREKEVVFRHTVLELSGADAGQDLGSGQSSRLTMKLS